MPLVRQPLPHELAGLRRHDAEALPPLATGGCLVRTLWSGVSRGTVSAIAQGKRDDLRRRPIDDWDEPLGPLVRCSECGGRVYAPCRLCRIRRLKADERADRRRLAGRNLALADKLMSRRRFDPTFG